MSYSEYKSLFDRCQEYAPYHLFVYDMINSRKVSDMRKRESDIARLIFAVYEEIENVERQTNKRILHRSKDLKYCKLKNKDGMFSIQYPENLERWDLSEPFALVGDLIGFTIERGTLNPLQVDYIFEQKKKELGLEEYSFHKANGFYETDKWEEGDKKYFRGYCIQQLEKNSKIKEKVSEDEEGRKQ